MALGISGQTPKDSNFNFYAGVILKASAITQKSLNNLSLPE